MTTQVAERMPDAPTPVRPSPDKPEVVEPIKAPGDTKKPKREPEVEVVEPPREPERQPRRQPR